MGQFVLYLHTLVFPSVILIQTYKISKSNSILYHTILYYTYMHVGSIIVYLMSVWAKVKDKNTIKSELKYLYWIQPQITILYTNVLYII